MLLKSFVCLLLHIHLTVSYPDGLKPHIFIFFPLDGFDVTKIRILEPPGTRKVIQADAATIGVSAKIPTDILNKTKAISRKRPFDSLDDSCVQRPRKKARVLDVHALVFPELYESSSLKKTQPVPPSAHNGTALKPDIQVPHHSIFPKHSGKASQVYTQRFLSQIRQTPADEANDIS